MIEEKQKIKMIIDTDAGTDVDDLFALAYALKNPNIEVKAISTVHGDTIVRAKIIRKLEKILGVSVPIIVGKPGDSRYWTGIETQALTPEELAEPIQELNFPKYDFNTTLVCIGPMTNIQYQLEQGNGIRNVNQIYIMGDHLHSHNFRADNEAALITGMQDWKRHLVAKQVCKKITLTQQDLEGLRGTELGNFLYDSAISWMKHSGVKEPIMYDAVTVSAAAQEGYVTFEDRGNCFISEDIDLSFKNKLLETIKK
jgi:purine nucleosidase